MHVRIIDCGSPKPANGLATLAGGTTYGANATLSCSAGYDLVGASLVTCNETGWSGNATCVIKGKMFFSHNLAYDCVTTCSMRILTTCISFSNLFNSVSL
jgi:hypothetical protein